jgi:hypothetical protein
VSNISTEMVAREMDLSMTAPTVRTAWGIPTTTAPMASGITLSDEKPTPMPADSNIPPKDDNGTHSGVNKNPANLRQVEKFLLQGVVVDECKLGSATAPCDCTTGACD